MNNILYKLIWKIYENIPIQCRMMVCFDLNHSNMVSFTVFVPGASLLLKSTMNQFLVVTCNIPRCSTPLNVYCQKSNIVLGKYSISLIKIEFQTSYFVHHIYRYRYLYTYPLIKYCNTISQITCKKKSISCIPQYIHIHCTYINHYHTSSSKQYIPCSQHTLSTASVCFVIFLSFRPPQLVSSTWTVRSIICRHAWVQQQMESQKPWVLFFVDWFLSII